MKIALNGATTMRADLATDINAASAAGFECPGIMTYSIHMERRA